MNIADIRSAIETSGLAWRGAFHPDSEDAAGDDTRTLILLGFAGRTNWPAFASSPEAADGASDPLDRWSRRVIGDLAQQLDSRALFPFGGPPWLPFQRWGRKAEALHPSPLGMLIHPDWGLWHSWRGALAFRELFELPPVDRRPSPCDTCAAKPCLRSCPVGAFSPSGYDAAACTDHLHSARGTDCMERGCRARHACPVGAEQAYDPEQAQFHMRAFRRRDDVSAPLRSSPR